MNLIKTNNKKFRMSQMENPKFQIFQSTWKNIFFHKVKK